MTHTQLLLLVGLIYVAPHLDKRVGLIVGLVFLIGSVVTGVLK